MDLCNIPSRYYPAYTWLWNSTITRYGIREQLREMYDEIYVSGPLTYEIETFTEDGKCQIQYYRCMTA